MKPIIKWAGGKSSLLKELKQLINPNTIGNHMYYEPFAGGAALALDLEYPNTVLGDLNSELINLYIVIRDYPAELINILEDLSLRHSINPEETYYSERNLDRTEDYNKLSNVRKAARTLYLNKTCFNGLYRVNSKGYFNSPLGKTASGKLPTIVDKDNIYELSKYFKMICFHQGDYRTTCINASKGDIIYLDSPYNYESTGFTAYQKEGWTNQDLVDLKSFTDELISKGCKVVISNNSNEFTRSVFNDNNYNYIEVDCKRSINSNKNGRGTVKELIVYSTNIFD